MPSFDFENISPNNNKEFSRHHNERKDSRKKIFRRAFLIGVGATALTLVEKEFRPKKKLSSFLLEKLSDFYNRRHLLDDKTSEPEPTEKPAPTDTPKSLPEQPIELTPMQNLAEEVLRSYHEIFRKENFLPPKIFSKNFLIATQLQESKYDPEAESHAGAVGVMQIMPNTIKDTIRCLHIFRKKGITDFSGPKMNELSEEDIEELKNLIKEKADYGRAFGKTYFAALFKIYNIGVSEYKKGNTKLAQKKLLAGYNGGLKTRSLPERRWRKETKNYCRRIFTYMDYLDDFQKKLKQNNIKSNNDYLSMLLVKEMTTYRKITAHDKLFDDLVNSYIAEIKNAENARQRALKDSEIKTITEKLHAKFTRFYLIQLSKIKHRSTQKAS